jgi:vitamin B12 transporter
MKKTLFTGLALAIMTSPAWAADTQQDVNKDEMVITATRSEENIKKIPAKIEVIDRQDIDLTAGQTLTEQLKKSSSISVIEYPGVLAGIGIRGFRPEFSGITKHSLILINGRPSGTTNLGTLLTDNVERIEVLKGPASSLYGAEAMGGVVNIITKKTTQEFTANAEAGFGSFETNFQKAAMGGPIADGFDFDLSAGRYDQQGNLKMGDGGDERPNTSYRTQNADLRLGADLGETWRMDISSNLYQGRDIETPGDLAYGDSQSGQKDIDNYGIDLKASGELGANNEFGVTGYVTREESENFKNHFYGSPVPTYHSYDSEINWYGSQLKDTYTWGDHKFITGIDYQYIEKESRSYKTSGSQKAPWSPDEARTNVAGYLETVWKFLDTRMTVTAGGRYDYFEVETLTTPYKTDFTPNAENFTYFSPRAGLNYGFDSGIRLHTTLGQAFVPPNAGQLAGYSERYVDGVTMVTKGNSDLDPENSTTWDIGAGFDKPELGLSFDLTYFYTDVNDRITRATQGLVTTYQNSLGAEIQGIEAEASFDLGAVLDWDRSLKFYLNSTNIIKAEEELMGGNMKDIHNVADYTYNYGVQYVDGMFDGKFHFRTVGEMRDTDWVTAGYPETEYPSFTVADIVLNVNFYTHHKLTFTIDNLFDEDYYEKKGFPKPGRAFFVSYTFSFPTN